MWDVFSHQQLIVPEPGNAHAWANPPAKLGCATRFPDPKGFAAAGGVRTVDATTAMLATANNHTRTTRRPTAALPEDWLETTRPHPIGTINRVGPIASNALRHHRRRRPTPRLCANAHNQRA
jgi:hypothetical protein